MPQLPAPHPPKPTKPTTQPTEKKKKNPSWGFEPLKVPLVHQRAGLKKC